MIRHHGKQRGQLGVHMSRYHLGLNGAGRQTLKLNYFSQVILKVTLYPEPEARTNYI